MGIVKKGLSEACGPALQGEVVRAHEADEADEADEVIPQPGQRLVGLLQARVVLVAAQALTCCVALLRYQHSAKALRRLGRADPACVGRLRPLAGVEPNAADLTRLVGELMARSQEFAGLWNR
ncbi:hypothetical protein KBP30_41445 [Streptomyces sp. Go40/10]|uniref:MmyB family transcriptional regulator n=1 Tax=Streptomyces sp. Go40/10 TaxID=2825844 RepID=UPI001E4C7162|nr:hypothetical protein [Streptomyces sp. Go40/10]UFQ99747.1 hypothetical protein KBP30_00160 [Streptomyces sp. Go40/10]UFR07199.1 hypothetical protein KBP30_41445 [Streptomyces sp. Go40/10]